MAKDIFLDLNRVNAPDVTMEDIRGEFSAALYLVQNGVAAWASDGDGSIFSKDISVGDITIYQFKEGIERFFITDINNPAASARAQSEIYVMFDDISMGNPEWMNHIPGGGNVLYMDGHVGWLRYPSELPFARGWVKLLDMLTSAQEG